LFAYFEYRHLKTHKKYINKKKTTYIDEKTPLQRENEFFHFIILYYIPLEKIEIYFGVGICCSSPRNLSNP